MPSYKDNIYSPRTFLGTLARYGSLILQLTRREIAIAYKGSLFGVLWSLVTPLLLLSVYTFIFSQVFKMRWGSGAGSHLDTALNLFAGVILHQCLSECLSEAPGLVAKNVNYVKKVVFPLDTLSYVSIFKNFFHCFLALLVLLIFVCAARGLPPLTSVMLPLVLLPFMLFVLGISWLLSALSVYIRDIDQFIGTLTTVLAFMTPIFYPLSAVPERFQVIIQLNPLTPAVLGVRRLLLDGMPPEWNVIAIYWAAGFAMAMFGHMTFRKLQGGFADVL